MPTCCCVPCCSTRGGAKFPKDQNLKRAWVKAIRRNSNTKKYEFWEPGEFSVVCHKHFMDDDYITETAHRTAPLKRQIKPDAVPSVFPWSKTKTSTRSLRLQQLQHEEIIEENSLTNDECDVSCVSAECTISTCFDMNSENLDKSLSVEENNIISADSSTQTQPMPLLSVENFIFDDEAFRFYTGLASYTDVCHVLFSLGIACFHLNYLYNAVVNVSVENQLFLTLIKLRQHKTNFELSRLFGVSIKTVMNIWITWINFMYRQWKEISFWPERDIVHFFAPSDFNSKFPTTRVIIDGTECPVKKPKPPIAQQCSFSTYKNRNTIKVLVGSTPGGLVSYISPAYGGSASDRQIVKRSNLINICDPGDSVMSDKGFNVQDLFAPRDITVNIPTFFKKRNRMSGKTVLRDRKISSKRVHIERIIGLAKTYKILKNPMNTTETKLDSEITFVCFALCNFRKCIISKHV